MVCTYTWKYIRIVSSRANVPRLDRRSCNGSDVFSKCPLHGTAKTDELRSMMESSYAVSGFCTLVLVPRYDTEEIESVRGYYCVRFEDTRRVATAISCFLRERDEGSWRGSRPIVPSSVVGGWDLDIRS